MWRRLLGQRMEGARGALAGTVAGLGHAMSGRLSGARAALSEGDRGLRTTWVAAMADNGLAALYQGGTRIRRAADFGRGAFCALMSDGTMTGEVKEIEVRGDS
jgi:hypothetical protein